MRRLSVVRFGAVLLALLSSAVFAPGHAQTSTGVTIKWEVKSRFRLFKNEDDFNYMVQSHGHDGVLADETALAAETKGIGWASRIVMRLCTTAAGGVQDPCPRSYTAPNGAARETVSEHYLVPDSHRIGLTAEGAPDGALCSWDFGNDIKPDVVRDQPCSSEVFVRVPYRRTAHVKLFVAAHPEDSQPSATADIAVRDILIAGLGDSTAAGEGDPDREIALDDDGFCFRRFESGEGASYYRPGRLGYNGNRSCGDDGRSATDDALNWAKVRAVWMDRACHRSLYSYQVRVALAIAIENPQLAVTYIPLGCTGATIEKGLLDAQSARESDCAPGAGPSSCAYSVGAQIEALRQELGAAHGRDRNRELDLLLLTIGANDINFSGMVANVMIDHSSPEFGVFSTAGQVSTVDAARQALAGLPSEFAKLRAQLRALIGNRLQRVVYVSYGHPGLSNGQPCGETRQGFDVHPAFAISGPLLKTTSDFVIRDFFPRLKAIATCGGGGGCQSPEQDRMTFVDEHQAQFQNHGFCAQSEADPAFDRACFLRNGLSFRSDQIEAPTHPLTCRMQAYQFRAYAPRQRWIRTANDSYFAAMTYPDAEPLFLQPQDIHDPLWGAVSAVYGGAMHPTAQGYAAMADAALPAARQLLGLPAPAPPH
jgi:lysophospholipase L1-like esterase